MTQTDIFDMAKQAGFPTNYNDTIFLHEKEIGVFAKLVAEKERERISQKIAQLPFGDTAQSLSIWVKNDT